MIDFKGDLEEFADWFSQKYVSAMDIWMSVDRIKDLYELYETDKYKFMAVPKEFMATGYESIGWTIFEEEFNYENYDAVLYKLK